MPRVNKPVHANIRGCSHMLNQVCLCQTVALQAFFPLLLKAGTAAPSESFGREGEIKRETTIKALQWKEDGAYGLDLGQF